jgi:hypothetical protein
MRESEMRSRVAGFLRRRILAPTFGLGLVFGGCGETSSEYGTIIPAEYRDAASDAFRAYDANPAGLDAAVDQPSIDAALAADARPDRSGETGQGLDGNGDLDVMEKDAF